MRVIGDGGHAAVIRELIDAMPLRFGDNFAVVAIGDNAARKRTAAEHTLDVFPPLVHPSAVVARSAKLGAGCVVMAGAVIQAGACIGPFAIVNTCASVDHHCMVGAYAHIAPGAHLCGGVEVGEGALIGVGVGVAPGAKIPAWSLVKARRLEICPTK